MSPETCHPSNRRCPWCSPEPPSRHPDPAANSRPPRAPRRRRSSIALSLGAFVAALAATAPAGAQCVTTCPGGAIQQNDACGGLKPDPNGGCDGAPALFQNIGTLSLGVPKTVCGAAGTFGINGRDADWYRFTLAEPMSVRVTLTHKDGGGNPWPNAKLVIIEGDDCNDLATRFSGVGGTCPFVSEDVPLPAGSHLLVVTVDAVAPEAPACPATYRAVLEAIDFLPAQCGGGGSCIEPHAEGGCDTFACCTQVCQVFSSCCDTGWDRTCVEIAMRTCGDLIYMCQPAGGAPVNDCATNAMAILVNQTKNFNTNNATTDGPPTSCQGAKDIWYVLQAPADGLLDVVVNSAFDSTLALFALGASPIVDGNELPGLLVGCSNSFGGGSVQLLAAATAGDHYLIQVAGFDDGGAASGFGNVTVSSIETPCGSGGRCDQEHATPGCDDTSCCNMVCAVDPFCCDAAWDANCVIDATMLCGYFPPANDDCDHAATITNGVTPFSTLGATTDGPALPPQCGEGPPLLFVNDIWFLYTATCDGIATFSTCNSANFDTRLALYTLPCTDLGLLCCNDDAAGCGSFTSKLACDVQCGKTYLLRVGAYQGAGTGTLDVSCSGTPCNKCCEDPVCTVWLRSGQVNGAPGAPWQLDSEIRYWTNAPPGSCSNASLADASGLLPFACVAPATIVAPFGSDWKPTLDCDPLARWVNSQIYPLDPDGLGFPGQSAMYCHPFYVCDEFFNTACITFCWMVDNRLGDPPGDPAPVGLYLDNGSTMTPIPAVFGGGWSFETTVTATIPAGALKPGLNRLWMYQRNLLCGASGLIYSARIDLCRSCVAPPSGMKGWWPLDETTGVVADDLTSNGHDGLWQGGPTPVAGVVDGALSFDGIDDHVAVPHSSSLNVGCQPFAVDAWIKWTPAAPGSNSAMVVSHLGGAGWGLAVSNGEYSPSGRLELFLYTDCTSGSFPSATSVPPSTWTHVAVSVSGCQCATGCGDPLDPNDVCCADPSYTRSYTFYINGQVAGTVIGHPYNGCNLDDNFTVPSPKLAIGARYKERSVYYFFTGAIDEVEFFCRELAQSEVQAIWQAGAILGKGKCKESCWASSDRQVCGDADPSDCSATIANASSQFVTYSYTITEDPSCPVTGMVYTPSSGTIIVGPNDSGTIMFGADGGGASGYGKACFKVRFVNDDTGASCTALGNVIYKDCGGGTTDLRGFEAADVVLPSGGEALGGFQFVAGPNGAQLDYQIVAVPQDAALADFPLSLDGLPPGEPIVGTLDLTPDGDFGIDFPISWFWCGWFAGWFEVHFLVAPAGSGGPYTTVSSFTVTMGAAKANDCPADLDGDGEVGGADLGIMLGSFGGPGAGDLDGSGTVDGGDLGVLLGAWGPCP